MAGTLLALSLVGDAFADDPKPVRIAYFGFAANNTFTMATWEGLQQAAEEAEGQVHVEFFDGKFDAQVQFNQIQDAVAAGTLRCHVHISHGLFVRGSRSRGSNRSRN